MLSCSRSPRRRPHWHKPSLKAQPSSSRRGSSAVSRANENIVFHVPNCCLMSNWIVKHVVWPAVAVEVSSSHQVIPGRNDWSRPAAGVGDSMHIPDHGLTRSLSEQQVIGVAISVEIHNTS